MIGERIQEYFNNNEGLRVLFFFDPSKEYEKEVENLDLPDIHTEIYLNTPFSTKYKLLFELRSEKVFLYLPMASPSNQKEYHDFPLLGLLLANKELRLDDVGEFMERYDLQQNYKSLVSKYISELKYSGVQNICQPILKISDFKETELQKALVSSFLKFNKIESWPLIAARLMIIASKKDSNAIDRVIRKITSLHISKDIIDKLREAVGININTLNKEELMKMSQGVLYNKITFDLPKKEKDPYRSFEIQQISNITRLNQMLFEVERYRLEAKRFNDLLVQMQSYIKGEVLIDTYGVAAQYSFYTRAMVWEIVNRTQNNFIDNPEKVVNIFEKIIVNQEFEPDTANLIRYMIRAGKVLQQIFRIETYVLDNPDEYIEEYVNNWCDIDKFYRSAVNLIKMIDDTVLPDKIILSEIHANLNLKYEKHLETLNREWLSCLSHFKFDYQKILTSKQYDLFKDKIVEQEQKVVVLISDALRYEVGDQLVSKLHEDKRNTAKITPLLASIPSKTNIGMSQLLPFKAIEFNNGDIKLDGTINSGISNRREILGKHRDNVEAIQYSNIEGMDQRQLREVFKNDIVYVYHDVIDSTGDKRSSERRTFEVVEDAINELKQFTKKLHSSYNVSKVFITSDHGFLYNDREIKEKEKQQLPNADLIQSHNRFFISKEKIDNDLGYCFPLNATTKFEEQVFITIPASTNRFRKQGVGHQFVHGGGSLQELIIPLIESSRKRENVADKVNVILVNKDKLKIVSNILRLNILQENELSRFEKQRSIRIGLYKESSLVSNEEILALKSTSESPSERMSRVVLTLSNDASDFTLLKVKIFDIEDTLNPLIEEVVHNNTIIQNDF